MPKVSVVLDSIKDSVVKIQTNMKKGSGVLINETGTIITNYHVIAGASYITVTLHDGSSKSSTLIKSDSSRDIAIINIFGKGHTYLPLEGSITPEIGDPLYALGYPLLGNYAVTAGIMSSTVTLSKGPYKYIQTDAALNPGNSGGPLVDEYGNLVGINTSRMESNAGRSVQGVGYALLVSTEKEYIKSLIK
jgi:serine protease Do